MRIGSIDGGGANRVGSGRVSSGRVDPGRVDAESRALPRIRCWRQAAAAMPAPHSHDDIEVVVVDGDRPAQFEHVGRFVEFAPNRVSVFWALYPHTLSACSSGAVLRRLMVPSKLIWSRRLPRALVAELLAGRMLSAPSDPTLERRFAQWEADLRSDRGQDRLAMMLEIEAWLRRIAPALTAGQTTATTGQADGSAGSAGATAPIDAVAGMCRYILGHVRDPIHVEDVAVAAGLRPQQAMARFHQAVGTTIADYISRCRVLEAQRLLVDTDATVADVGFEAGFGSVSQFYQRFTTSCGQTPLQYRKAALSA
jgi:AraC-like DNA-binding protein